MVTKTGKINNSYGIHCRPSGVIAKALKGYDGVAEIISPDGASANPRSVISILSLALTCGDSFTVKVEGTDEEKVCQQLVDLLEAHYDFQKD